MEIITDPKKSLTHFSQRGDDLHEIHKYNNMFCVKNVWIFSFYFISIQLNDNVAENRSTAVGQWNRVQKGASSDVILSDTVLWGMEREKQRDALGPRICCVTEMEFLAFLRASALFGHLRAHSNVCPGRVKEGQHYAELPSMINMSKFMAHLFIGCIC